MSKRAVITAISLVSIGIIFGAVLVTGIGGISLSLAGAGAEFTTNAPYAPPEGVASLNETFTSVSSLVTPTVVFIRVKTKQTTQTPFFWPFGDVVPKGEERLQEGSGSGIILTQDGYILTNRHVVTGATEDGIKVTLNDSREFNARLVGSDENTDVAVIKIETSGLTPASLGNSDEVKVGEWVLAVGNPFGLTSTVTAGIVSAISRNVGIMQDQGGTGIENFIQTDAAINPGSSGGALVNLKGQVVGVNTAIFSSIGRYIGYGFAVPINLAKVVANGIIKEGKFVRGYIGIKISSMDAKKAKALDLDQYHGVLVESVQEDGAGKEAGVKAGDVIVEVDGKDVQSANELQARVGMHHPGEEVKLKLFRDGKYYDLKVKLKGREGESETIASEEADKTTKDEYSDTKKPLAFERAGFTVQALDAQAKKKFDRKTGVLVTDVKRYSPAFENNLRPGVVIFEARKGGNIIKIETISDLNKVLGSLKEGEGVLLRVQTEGGDTVFIPIEGPVK